MAQATIQAPAVKVKDSDIEFFSPVDRNKHGRIAANYPSFYDSGNIEEAQEEISTLAGRLERGEIRGDCVPSMKAELKAK